MWCTRWYLPLLLLPFPSTSPYFLLVFLFSVTLHARPCLYCILLLGALFTSSCHWEPVSTMDLLQQYPSVLGPNLTWSAVAPGVQLSSNITVLNSTHSYTLPKFTRLIDRCWCDISTRGLFSAYNITKWELESLAASLKKGSQEPLSQTADRLPHDEDTYDVAAYTDTDGPRMKEDDRDKAGPTPSVGQSDLPQQSQVLDAEDTSVDKEPLGSVPKAAVTSRFLPWEGLYSLRVPISNFLSRLIWQPTLRITRIVRTMVDLSGTLPSRKTLPSAPMATVLDGERTKPEPDISSLPESSSPADPEMAAVDGILRNTSEGVWASFNRRYDLSTYGIGLVVSVL